MLTLGRTNLNLTTQYTNRVLVFGGGNFVRGFIGWIIDTYNKKGGDLGVTVVKVTPGDYKEWREQDGLYHVVTKGFKGGEMISEIDRIDSFQNIISIYEEWDVFFKTAQNPDLELIISNTTESGLVYIEEDISTEIPATFPGKLTKWLFERYLFFKGDSQRGVTLMPSELVEGNGNLLKEIILKYAVAFDYPNGFSNWITEACHFCNTLVDRIVPGLPESEMESVWEEVGFVDKLATQGEPYLLLAIEADEFVRDRFPFDKIGLNVVYTHDLAPYRLQKVRILNGAHSAMVPVGLLYGLETVGEVMKEDKMFHFIGSLVDKEIIPATNMDPDQLKQYASDIMDRFRNPFIHHKLMTISLNSFSKFKARHLPIILDYVEKFDKLPNHLVLVFAAMLRLYKGQIGGNNIELKDDPYALNKMKEVWDKTDGSEASLRSLVLEIAKDENLWDQDLSKIPLFVNQTAEYLISIEQGRISELLDELADTKRKLV